MDINMATKWIPFTIYIFVMLLKCEAKPARGCPRYGGTFYIPDDQDMCVYYRCLNGYRIGPAARCEYGKGVSLFFSSNSHPCKLAISDCSRHHNYIGPGSGGRRVTFPPPTKSVYTAVPEETTAAMETTESQTTELIGMTTEEESDMTTEETTTDEMTTEEMGSGDGDEPLPGTPGVFFDYGASGGLPVTATDMNECLKACAQLQDLCWGLDWSEPEKQCHLYFTVSGDQCGALESKADNVHFRFKC